MSQSLMFGSTKPHLTRSWLSRACCPGALGSCSGSGARSHKCFHSANKWTCCWAVSASKNLGFLLCGCDVAVCEVFKLICGSRPHFGFCVNMVVRAWCGQFSVLSSRAAGLPQVLVLRSFAVQLSSSAARHRGEFFETDCDASVLKSHRSYQRRHQ